MNIVAVYGAEHKGSTYHIAQLFLEQLFPQTSELTEFFLPRDMPHFCVGCSTCFMKSEEGCPHHEQVGRILKAMEKADLLIFASPVYVFHATGQMKTLLDHFGYQWMVHRPNQTMFTKQALVISTAAGGGMKSTNKDIKDSLSFWGVGRIFTYGKGVAAVNWQGVSEKNRAKIEKAVRKLSPKIRKGVGKVTPSLKTKLLFYGVRLMQKRMSFNPADSEYWQKQGWLGKARPWKKANECEPNTPNGAD